MREVSHIEILPWLYLTNYLLYAINLCLKKKITIFNLLRFSKCKNLEMSKLRDGVFVENICIHG